MLNKDMLFEGIPCIFDKSRYIIFSPYLKKVAVLSKRELKDINIKKKLKKQSFFGEPIKKGCKNDIAKVGPILTNDCNLRCKYCYCFGGEKKDYMTKEIAIASINEAIKNHPKELQITFFGGEPTLNFPIIKEVVAYVNKLNIPRKFIISTNGIMSRDKLDYIIKNKFIVKLSMDGTEKIQNFHRPFPNNKSSFKIVERTIKKLVKNKIVFRVRATVTEYSVGKMSNFIDYLGKLGVKFVHFEPLNPVGRTKKNKIKPPIPKKYAENFIKAFGKAKKYNMTVLTSAYFNIFNPSVHYCSAVAGEKLKVGPKGHLSLCYEVQDDCHPLSKDFIIGKYDRKLKKFVFDFKKFKRMTALKISDYNECSNCFAKYICSGGGPIRNVSYSGKLNKVNRYMCQIKKYLIHEAILRLAHHPKKDD